MVIHGTENGLLACSRQGFVFLFATGVIIVEAGGRPNHKKWLMGAQVCTYKEAQLMGAQGGV